MKTRCVRLRVRDGCRARGPDAGAPGHEQHGRQPIWSSELNGGPWGLSTDASRRGGHHRRRRGPRPRLRRHDAMGGEGRRHPDGLPGPHQAISCSSVPPDVSSPSGAATARSAGNSRRTARCMPSHWQARTRSPATRWHAPCVRREQLVRSRGRLTTRASSRRRRRSTWQRRSSSRSGTKNRHLPRAPSTSRPVTLRWEHAVGLYTAAPGLDHGRAIVATGDGHYHAWIAAFDLDRPAIRVGLHDARVVPDRRRARSDGRDLVVVDRIGRVTAFDPVAGAVRWTRPLNRNVIDTRVVLLPRRVVITTLVGQLFVLDRVSGRVVAHADGRDFERHSGARGACPSTRSDARHDSSLAEPGPVEMRRVP